MAKIIDGKALASKIRQELKTEVDKLKTNGIKPGLAVILVGNNPASKVYVNAKGKACEEVGINSLQHNLPENVEQKELISLIQRLNNTPDVHGILVQLPLPAHIDEENVLEAISPYKDVDGFHPFNIGRLAIGKPALQPCTPFGIMKLLESEGLEISGKHAVVVGRSNIVGKPAAIMLLERHATVTICHSRTKNLSDVTRQADILIAAVGRPKMVKGDWIKKGAIVIDVGVNRLENGSLAGDVDFEEAKQIASAITPVPGGVGPMTIAMLLNNTIEAAKRQSSR
ncbi:MAG: bifunctional methylenetetrahydrofolate dehydrogenase/methenyltetrahydrofolate cyclohydrolase FolD [Deltaproteobacteria bacterium]|nr:bifunctional methylenetetrahydrofolate dehydrogenase/methenyltetrahydrofolate cyclohydrolase FolD [Deltaproteobacteria bacterium]